MITGAAYVSALAMWAGQAEESGPRVRELRTFIMGHFGPDLYRFAVAILAVSVVMGALLGLVARFLVACRDRMARRRVRSPYGLALESFCVVAALHTAWVAWAMARRPALYAKSFYIQGGLRRLVQIVVCDVLGPTGVTLIGFALLLVYLAGPRAQWSFWPGRLRRAIGVPGAACIAVLAGFLFGLSRPQPPELSFPASPAPASGQKPVNILLLAADSLRADRFNARTMPYMTQLAEHATVFEKAYVSVPRTFPSWTSWLTGRSPHHHGIVTMFPRWEDRAKDFDAAPSRFRRAGYRTMVVTDFVGDIFSRIDLGFSEVDAPAFDVVELLRESMTQRETPLLPLLHTRIGRRLLPIMHEVNPAADPELLVDEVLETIDRGPRDQPFFMTVFFGTSHFPYPAPAPFHKRFTSPDYRGPYKYSKPVELDLGAKENDEDIAQIRNLYDGAVASVDQAFARILEELRKRNLAERTIVVLLGDHGEQLFEFGRNHGHGDHLFGDKQTHVPLVIYDPRVNVGRRVSRIVRDVDLVPTLYELANLAQPPVSEPLDGRSLAPALTGGDLAPTLAYSETEIWFSEEVSPLSADGLRIPYPDVEQITEVDDLHHSEMVMRKEMMPTIVASKHRMARDERFKLVYMPTRKGARYMLFDTLADPEELHDVSAEHPEETARLGAELRAYILRDPNLTMRNGVAVPRDAVSSARPEVSGLAGTTFHAAVLPP
ncbi:sulfatase-like hydrolase/transferase [Pendulispora brunnea]|uniref:Sulfatase-like hydrolase/transferase n=1 Tax=Pendulispora brunnea TaxID=2905690 RepID=A0ABZ2KGX5_9BACT